ncbi:hypothetical protein JCM17478_36840 [Thermopirellula anaerolimosa]
MRLRAKVRKTTGPSTNYIGAIVDQKPVPTEQLPNPVSLEISEEEGAFFLLYINAAGESFADTWHQTLESAKREAMLGFGITPEEWTEV